MPHSGAEPVFSVLFGIKDNPDLFARFVLVKADVACLFGCRLRLLSDLFAFHVKGDSMIDAMVNDGDIVIMKPTREALNGELVAVWLNDRDETTLKYFYKENGSVRLQPANPTMKPIYINDPSIIEIQGKVIMVIRQIEG